MQIQYFLAGLAVTVVNSGLTAPASAQQYRPEHQGTYEQQMACTGDVFRLCSREIPDEGRITNCLRGNVPSLSRGCRAVFEPATGSVPQEGRRRDQRDDYPRDAYQRNRNYPRDRDDFNNDSFGRPPPPAYDNRRDRDDDD